MKNSATSITKLLSNTKVLRPYVGILAVLLIVGACAYLVFLAQQASNVTASTDSVAGVKKAPRIDESLVQRIQTLQDNSVSVRTLFNEARTNPFESN